MDTVKKRETASDRRYHPRGHYVCIKRQEAGSLYMGQTIDLRSRVVEPQIDAGVVATKGQGSPLVRFSHTHDDRNTAPQLERRLQAALKRSPLEIEEMADRFSGLMALIRLPKTLQQLRDEEHQFNAAKGSAFNHVRVILNGYQGGMCVIPSPSGRGLG